jgi:hypothetical protein
MDLDVRNVLIYVDDAVRYDALATELATLGPTYRTIAASTHTPTSFGSLLTGLYPPVNGITSFAHQPATSVRSITDLETHTVSVAARGGMNHSIATMFGDPSRATIEDLEPPFVHIVRRPGGHTPYDGFDMTTFEWANERGNETGREYLYRMANDPAQARQEYYDGVQTSFEEFQRVLAVLERRGLAEDTLVVYTSDHGELLGEYGFFGHTHLATPEIVYVPTTLIHPSLTPESAEALFHHVDLLPTIEASVDDLDIGRTHGSALGEGRTNGYNHFAHVRYGTIPDGAEALIRAIGGFERLVRSVWDRNGGHVFVDGSRVKTTALFAGLLLQAPIGRQLYHSRRISDVYARFAPGHQSYGSPAFSAAEARQEIDALPTDLSSSQDVDLDEQTVERLRDMGYI